MRDINYDNELNIINTTRRLRESALSVELSKITIPHHVRSLLKRSKKSIFSHL